MQIIKEKLEMEEALKKRINYLLKFNNIKGKLENGYIISLSNTNIAYIQPHKLVINNSTYLFQFEILQTFYLWGKLATSELFVIHTYPAKIVTLDLVH